MLLYLSKKIAIPNAVKLCCLSWNLDQGWIACGGANGLLKVLKLDVEVHPDSKVKGVAAPSNLTMNQSLDGHNGSVVCVTWNHQYRKLTTSDSNGLIIVWMLHRGLWFEEMINNRNKSIVRDMKWTPDGQKICIVYEDGAVIVGSVDGNRIWGKELKLELSLVEWSPNCRNILFATQEGEIQMYDHVGSKITNLPLYSDEDAKSLSVVGMHWYDGSEGHMSEDTPTLAVAFFNGKVQITRGEDSTHSPILIDTGLTLQLCKWNSNGTVLALVGIQQGNSNTGGQEDSKDMNVVQFYSPYGDHLRSLKVPGTSIKALSWEGGGLRIALAVDSHIYFANIRPDYHWGYFGNTLVYCYNKPDRIENCVVFWNTHSDERHTKYVKGLVCIKTAKGRNSDHCLLVARDQSVPGSYLMILCDAIGSPVDTKQIYMEPKHVAMTKLYCIVASEDTVYFWQYRLAGAKVATVMDMILSDNRRKEKREKIFFIEDLHNIVSSDTASFMKPDKLVNDPICSICASDTCLIVGRASGVLHSFTLPHLRMEGKYLLRCRPQSMAINCNDTRISIIDIHGVLSFFDLESDTSNLSSTGLSVNHLDEGHTVQQQQQYQNRSVKLMGSNHGGEHLSIERKDVWDMLWAESNPELFVMMEKSRMYVFRGLEPEEPVLSSGYLCTYKDLQVKAVLLDELMQNPEQPEKEMMMDFETKSLRDARELIVNVGLQEAYQYIEEHPHPRLWRLLAEAALVQLDFSMTERCFVQCSDYQGIQYVKRLYQLDDRMKQKAEVASYFQKFDEAEAIYRDMDRKDLAIELRMRLGDWFRVVQLVQSGGGDDTLLAEAWNKIGEYYAERQKWEKATKYFVQAKNWETLAHCYYVLEDFQSLNQLIHTLADGSPLLKNIGEKFQSVGMSENAVQAFLKLGDVKSAIDSCVILNQWHRAVELAEEHHFPQIEGLLIKYGQYLLDHNKPLQAIELYRKANKSTEAAKLLAHLANQMHKTPLLAKKLYVLAALEMERFRKRILEPITTTTTTMNTSTTPTSMMTSTTAQTLDHLMQHDSATGDNKSLDNAWRGAEAYHLFLLAHRQLYLGQVEKAMKTSIKLTDYDDLLQIQDVYSLITLTSFYSKHYHQASLALQRLETLSSLHENEKQKYSSLAFEIFTKITPQDPNTKTYSCSSCGENAKDWQSSCTKCNKHFPICMATGLAIFDQKSFFCRNCRHSCIESELRHFNHCPLCHAAIAIAMT